MDFCVRGREGLRHDENKALTFERYYGILDT